MQKEITETVPEKPKKKRPDRDFFLQKFTGAKIPCPLPEEIRERGRPTSYKEWGIFVFKNDVQAGRSKTRECVTLARYRTFDDTEGMLHYPRNEAGHFFYDLVSVPVEIANQVATAIMEMVGKPPSGDDKAAETLKKMRMLGIR